MEVAAAVGMAGARANLGRAVGEGGGYELYIDATVVTLSGAVATPPLLTPLAQQPQPPSPPPFPPPQPPPRSPLPFSPPQPPSYPPLTATCASVYANTPSSSYTHYCNVAITSAYESASLAFTWRDQGWGSRKGRVRAVLTRDSRRVGVYYAPLAPHDETSVSMELRFGEHFVSQAEAGVERAIRRRYRDSAMRKACSDP